MVVRIVGGRAHAQARMPAAALGLLRQLGLSPRTVLQYLMPPVVLHFFPLPALDTRAQAGDAESRFSIKLAYLNAGRVNAHMSCCLLRGVDFDCDVRQSLEAPQRGVVEGWPAQRFIGDYRNHRTKVTGAKTPHVQVDQLVTGRFDGCPYFVGQCIAGADVHQVRAGIAYQAE